MLPRTLKITVDKCVEIVRSDVQHDLKPFYRLGLYNVLNSLSSSGRQTHISLALLTTEKVLPLWKPSLVLAEIIEDEDEEDKTKYSFLKRSPNSNFIGVEDVYKVPNEEFPQYLIETARQVLAGNISIERANREAREAGEILGRNLGFSEDEFPITAYYVGCSALETLQLANGKEPFKYFRIDPTSTDSVLAGRGDAASGAVLAYIRSLGDNYSNNLLLNKHLEFWEWWLTEAIPQAWELAQQTDTPQ